MRIVIEDAERSEPDDAEEPFVFGRIFHGTMTTVDENGQRIPPKMGDVSRAWLERPARKPAA
jgi:hypothetical protein